MNTRDPFSLSGEFKENIVVPASMRWAKLSADMCPSNVALLKVDTFDAAIELAFEKLRMGVQAAVWSMGEKIHTLKAKEYDAQLEQLRARRCESLRRHFKTVVSVTRHECVSNFAAHIDGIGCGTDMLDNYPGIIPKGLAHKLPVQVVQNHRGRGILLFGKNPVVAREYLETRMIANPSMLGTGYMVPTGSVTFLATRSWGIEHASLHSAAGQRERRTKQAVRDVSLCQCQDYTP